MASCDTTSASCSTEYAVSVDKVRPTHLLEPPRVTFPLGEQRLERPVIDRRADARRAGERVHVAPRLKLARVEAANQFDQAHRRGDGTIRVSIGDDVPNAGNRLAGELAAARGHGVLDG